MPKVVTVDNKQRDNIVLVPVTASAGYLNGYGDTKFIKKLPSYRMPNLNHGTFRMFEIDGHSMYPTLHSGSIVIGEWEEDWSNIKDNSIYIVVTESNGIVIKRVINRIKKYNSLYLKSDNRKQYPSYSVKPSDIIEVWKLKTTLLYEFQDPSTLYDRVSDLEAQLMFISDKLK